MKRIICTVLALIMLFSLTIPAFATNAIPNISTASTENTGLNITTVDPLESNNILLFSAEYSASANATLTISIDGSFLMDNTEVSVLLFNEIERTPVYSGTISEDQPHIRVDEMSIGEKYRIVAQSVQESLVDNIFGYFFIYEKNSVLCVLHKLTHEKYVSQEYCTNSVLALREATETSGYESALLRQMEDRAVRYEAESNNTQATADLVYDDDTTYGTIGYSGDVDYFKVRFTSNGNANFWLGDIPSGQDYDFFLYNSSGTQLKSSQTTANQEQIYEYPVTANTWYYLKVIGYGGSYDASNYYRVRAKNYPTETSGDSYEPNNSFSTATSIANNATLTTPTIHDDSDVDFYRVVLPSAASISITLSNIPSGCDYDLFLYSSSQVECESSENGGNAVESLTYSATAGTYYIKISSYNGSGSTSYRLSVSTGTSGTYPTSVDLTCTFAPAIPTNASSSSGTTTYIKQLPVKIYKVTNAGNLTQVASGTTSNTGTFSKSGISIGSNVTGLRVTVTFDNSSLSIQDNSGSIYSFSYDIPITSTNISVSLPGNNSLTEEQVLAYAAWKNGLAALSMHSSISSTSLGKLVFRSEVNDDLGSACYGTQYIHLNGSSATRDYLDTNVIQHEMGHWLMFKMNVFPSGAGGSHGYSGYYSNQLAYSEGWATFYSCAARGSSQMMDYFSPSSSNYGANISNARYYSSGWKQLDLSTDSYADNQMNELNAGTVFWAYRNHTNYSAVQNTLSPAKSSMQEVYDEAIADAATANKEAVWTLFNNRGCAFDLTLPTVSLTISGRTATVTASDNIAVKKLEWYVNGILKKTTTNATIDTLDLSNYTGTTTVQVRAYDPEGLASEPRPRTARYASIEKSTYFSSSRESTIIDSLSTLENVSDVNRTNLLSKQFALPVGNPITFTFETNGFEDISIYSHIIGCIEEIRLYSPDGELFDTIDYLCPDEPYVIENARAGTWSVVFTPITYNTMVEYIEADTIARGTGIDEQTLSTDAIDAFKEEFTSQIALSVTAVPAKVKLAGTIYTNDPYYLKEVLSNEQHVIIYSEGKQIRYTEELDDGNYSLEIVRRINGKISESSHIRLVVDTIAPNVTFDYDVDAYENGIFLHGICSSDTVEVRMNGEYVYMSAVPDFGVFIEFESIADIYEFELYDRSGNVTTIGFSINQN